MEKLFILKNAEEIEINDVPHNEIYDIEGFTYRLLIRPKCTFWRVGLRFSINRQGFSSSTTHRYNDTQIRHIEICVGTRENDEWQNPNVIQLQQYHIPKTDGTLISSAKYISESEVLVTVSFGPAGLIDIKLSHGDNVEHHTSINLGFARVFQVFGWSDWTAFELECKMTSELTPLLLTLRKIKALAAETTPLKLENLTIFFGTNNSGKTSLLIAACKAYQAMQKDSMDYIGLNRTYSESVYSIDVETLPEMQKRAIQEGNRRNRIEDKPGQHVPFDFIEELALQNDDTKSKILEWIALNFESWTISETKKGKFTTGMDAKVNGLHPVTQGTGAKAVVPIVIQLFNPEIKLLAIDEPELGLEAGKQKLLFLAIKDASEGKNGFPLKRIIVATHSHLFLDRQFVGNNLVVEKSNDDVSFHQIQTYNELQELTFKLLGSQPSDLFFPSNIVVVEGVSDHIFLKAIFEVGKTAGIFRSESLVFHYLDGISKAPQGTEGAVQMFKTQSYSAVYKEKICGIFDWSNEHSKTIDAIRKHFNDNGSERFVQLDKPGIEYYYPIDLINKLFGHSFNEHTYPKQIEEYLKSTSKKPPFVGKFLDESLTKRDLASRLASQLTKDNISQIDPTIIGFLKLADKLAY